jgi:hypothetical protein
MTKGCRRGPGAAKNRAYPSRGSILSKVGHLNDADRARGARPHLIGRW